MSANTAAQVQPVEILDLPLSWIQTEAGTQSRVSLIEEVVEEYSEHLRVGGTFPPVVVFHGEDQYYMAGGFHRLEAHRRVGLETIGAEVRKGGLRDAILFSVGDNATHGLRRSQADKRRAVEMLLRDPEWGQWSDNAIAKAARVDHKTVARVRLDLTWETPSDGERTYTTKHGTTATMNVGKIGKSQREEDSDALVPEEEAPEGNDLATELERALEENRLLRSQMETLRGDAGEGENAAADWQERYAALEGQLEDALRTATEAQKQAKRQAKVLSQVRKILGVEKDAEIVSALKDRIS